MNDTVRTVTIETSNGPVRINETDYDETKHKLHGSSALTPVNDAPPVSTATAPAGETPQTTAPAGETPQTTAPAGETTAVQPKLSVQKRGKKFFVVDENNENKDFANERIDANGYPNDGEAWQAILSLSAPAA